MVMKTKQVNGSLFLARFDPRMKEQRVNELYKTYKKKVYGIALSFVKDPYMAEDLAHEILVKCYLARDKFNGTSSFQSWMYRIASNHCIDFLRKSYRQRDLLHEDVDLFNDTDECTPESAVLTSCDCEELHDKLRQLPPKYKEVIYLYYFKDKSMKEIEYEMNIKLSTIKTRLFRAKRMLKHMC